MRSKLLSTEEYNRISTSACFICRIVQGNPLISGKSSIPDVQVIDEDNFTITFLSQFPVQEGYALVCPKRHIERFEFDMSGQQWARLQQKVQQIAKAIAAATEAKRMYTASWGSPEGNSHLHIHVCPCPKDTPLEQQQIAAMDYRDGELQLSNERMAEIARSIKECL